MRNLEALNLIWLLVLTILVNICLYSIKNMETNKYYITIKPEISTVEDRIPVFYMPDDDILKELSTDISKIKFKYGPAKELEENGCGRIFCTSKKDLNDCECRSWDN